MPDHLPVGLTLKGPGRGCGVNETRVQSGTVVPRDTQASSLEPMGVPLCGKGGLIDVIRLQNLRWGCSQ